MQARWWEGEPMTGAWCSRKINGVRAVFLDGVLWSRHGRRIAAPGWFTASLPRLALDGELHCHDSLPAMLSVLGRRSPAGWDRVEFAVFDIADPRPRVEARITALAALDLPAWCRVVRHERVESETWLEGHLAQAEAAGWEGVTFRPARSRYQSGRSWSLRKFRFAGAD